MPFISDEQLIGGYSQVTPDQVNFIRWFYRTFGNNSAAHRIILNVEPIFYQGLIAGTEFLTYAATKLYLCFSCQFGDSANHGENEGSIVLYNELNAAFYYVTNKNAYWETVGAKDEFIHNPIMLYNFYFSRLVQTIYTSMIFNGYRITLN
jgi:hypothetical protein